LDRLDKPFTVNGLRPVQPYYAAGRYWTARQSNNLYHPSSQKGVSNTMHRRSDTVTLTQPINEEIFDLAFDLLTCPPEDSALKEDLTSRYHSLKVDDLREFYLMAFFITCSLNVKEKALQYINKAFMSTSQDEAKFNIRRTTLCHQ
jgi:hypothetical protein